MPYLADIVIIMILAAAVFFILRGQIRRHRGGQCCAGCSRCGASCSCRNEHTEKVKK